MEALGQMLAFKGYAFVDLHLVAIYDGSSTVCSKPRCRGPR